MSVIAAFVVAGWLQGMSVVADMRARPIIQDAMSNVEEPRQVVARSEAEWIALWRLHAGDQPAPPAVDFSKEMVAAIFLGSRPTPGYSAHFIRARKDAATTVYEWIERRPERGAIVAQVLTSPVLIAAIPKFDGQIKFQKVDR